MTKATKTTTVTRIRPYVFEVKETITRGEEITSDSCFFDMHQYLESPSKDFPKETTVDMDDEDALRFEYLYRPLIDRHLK